MKAMVTALASVFFLLSGQVYAQAYPAKPIRFVVPYPAGTSLDVLGRMIVDEVRRTTGAVVVVDNKPGAFGIIGTDSVVKSAPDGYTIMISSSASHSSAPQLVKATSYDPIKDFTHIGKAHTFESVLAVNSSSRFKVLNDLITEARANPDKLTYGYGSTTSQVVSASFLRAAGIKLRGIPYKGQPQAMTDLLGGQVDMMAADVGLSLAQAKAGKIRPLAVAAARRVPQYPSTPTLGELGVNDVEISGWTGLSGPAGMPRESIAWWADNLKAALAQKSQYDRLLDMGFGPDFLGPDAFPEFVKAQLAVWEKHVRAAGMKPE